MPYFSYVTENCVATVGDVFARRQTAARFFCSRNLQALYKGGIFLPNGDNNHVLTSHGSTIDISQYAKKTDLPKMKFVSSLPETTDSNTLYFVI